MYNVHSKQNTYKALIQNTKQNTYYKTLILMISLNIIPLQLIFSVLT